MSKWAQMAKESSLGESFFKYIFQSLKKSELVESESADQGGILNCHLFLFLFCFST